MAIKNDYIRRFMIINDNSNVNINDNDNINDTSNISYNTH